MIFVALCQKPGTKVKYTLLYHRYNVKVNHPLATEPSQQEVSWSKLSPLAALPLGRQVGKKDTVRPSSLSCRGCFTSLDTHLKGDPLTLTLPPVFVISILLGPWRRAYKFSWFLCFWGWSSLGLFEGVCLSLDYRQFDCSVISAL